MPKHSCAHAERVAALAVFVVALFPSPAAAAAAASPEVTAPIVESKTPVVDSKPPVVEPKPPVVESKAPVVESKAPVVESKAPVVESKTPVVESKTPVVEPKPPIVEPELLVGLQKQPVAAAKTGGEGAGGPSPATFETRVVAARPLTAASAMTVRDQDLQLRPLARASDILRVVPGLLTVQHAGGGKANQFLLRGFDADHGTDIALSVDGLPVNMVSHAHGQGYSDVNFIIPELIERVDIAKGPYFVEHGDFATAGSVNLQVRRDLPQSLVQLSLDTLLGARGLVVVSPKLGPVRSLLAAEVSHTDGPFLNPENFNKLNILGKLSYDLSPHTVVSLTATSYAGAWAASGQIPARAVDSGELPYFGYVDKAEGGASSRHNVYLQLTHRDSKQELTALLYYTLYAFKLYSNFTLFARDPEHGDQIEQADDRQLGGLKVSYLRQDRVGWLTLQTGAGVQVRHDSIHNTLYYTQARARLSSVVDHDTRQTSLSAYLKEELGFSRYVRLYGGLRVDAFTFDVSDRLEVLGSGERGAASSGVAGALRFSPKASLIVSPLPTGAARVGSLDLFVNFGYGFHSNDARGVVRSVDAVTPLTPALGYEVGARTRLWQRLDLAASLWGLDLDSELVWVGDEGRTEASDATRRLGVEVEGRLRVLDWLFADLDFTANDAKFAQNAGNGGAVALAPRITVSAGLSVKTAQGLRGSLRFTGISARPATEDGFLEASAQYTLDAFVGYRWRFLEASIAVDNLTNARYRSAQFATTSRLASEAPTTVPPPAGACPAGTRAQTTDSGNFAGCEDLNFTPGYPINARFTLAAYF